MTITSLEESTKDITSIAACIWTACVSVKHTSYQVSKLFFVPHEDKSLLITYKHSHSAQKSASVVSSSSSDKHSLLHKSICILQVCIAGPPLCTAPLNQVLWLFFTYIVLKNPAPNSRFFSMHLLNMPECNLNHGVFMINIILLMLSLSEREVSTFSTYRMPFRCTLCVRPDLCWLNSGGYG